MKLVPMKTENGYEYLWPQPSEDEKRDTNLDMVHYASMKGFYNKPGQHALVLGGQYGCLPLETEILWANRKNKKPIPVQLRKILNHHGFVLVHNWKNQKTKVAPAVVKPSGTKKVFRITLEDGKTVSASADHIFFVRENGEIKEKHVSQLKHGDQVIVDE